MSASFGSGRPKDPVGVECYFSPACRLGLVAFRRTTVQPTDGVDCHREEPPPANLRSDHPEGVAVAAGAAAGHVQLDLTDVEAPLLLGLSALHWAMTDMGRGRGKTRHTTVGDVRCLPGITVGTPVGRIGACGLSEAIRF